MIRITYITRKSRIRLVQITSSMSDENNFIFADTNNFVFADGNNFTFAT